MSNDSAQDLTPKVDSPIAPEPYVPMAIALELPHVNPKFHPATLGPQKEKFVHYLISGMSPGQAAVAVGATPQAGGQWANAPLVVQALEYFRSKNREKLDFTIETAHQMYLDTYRLAEAKEDPIAMKNVVDSLVKLHGIAAAAKPQEVKITVTNEKQALRLTDEQLLEQAGLAPDYLIPRKRQVPEASVDAEFTDVTKETNE